MKIPDYPNRNRQPYLNQDYYSSFSSIPATSQVIDPSTLILEDLILNSFPTAFIPPPTKVLHRRADETATETSSQDYPTDSKGCLVCPTTVGTCPSCTGNTVCQQRTLTCHQCPEFYCAPADNGTSKSVPIGGIVGGVIGFIVICGLLAGYYYYNYVYRKKHPALMSDDDMSYDEDGNPIDDDDQAMMMNDIHDGDLDDDDHSDYKGIDPNNVGNTSSSANNSSASDSFINGGNNTNSTNQNLEKPVTRRTNSGGIIANPSAAKSKARRRLSSYESFTKPQYRNKANNANNKGGNTKQMNQALQAAQRRARQREIVLRANEQQQQQQQNQNQQSSLEHSVYLDSNSSNRNSVATSFSTTNASNILPIAYIPGVTVRPTVNNTRSIYSYDSESLFSDLNTIENASIIGDVRRSQFDSSTTLAPGSGASGPNSNNSSSDEVNSGSSSDNSGTMTAIKAQPRLVNVDRIEEEEEEEVTDDEDDDESLDNEGTFRSDTDGDYKKLGGDSTMNNSTSNINTSTLTNFIINEEDDDDEDSDVDSDIGEITRATSVRKKKRSSGTAATNSTSGNNSSSNVQPDREILLDIASQHNTNSLASSQFQPPHSLQPLQTSTSPHGSFVLDVEMDNRKVRPQSDESGERSPFEDPSED
ncbi:hypothetical protein DFJ63DRAFT_310902 [Scheffersomyces coipomensis]|uniref:uncharacterized protein n=1 Tax=Scheffersomyces coipomensis TaxID=1788519 RepID=UPI00315C983E